MHSPTPPTHWTLPPPDTMNQIPPTSPHLPPPQMNLQSSPPAYSDANNAFLYSQSPPPPQNDWSGPPQYPGPPAGGTKYFTQGQPMSPYAQQQQQQQQSVVVIGAANSAYSTPTVIVQQDAIESYIGHQVFACIVMWFCNWLFGLIAWILARKLIDL